MPQTLKISNSNLCLNLFDYRLSNHDLLGAINYSILEAERATNIAHISLEEIEKDYLKIKNLANKALNKYPIL